MLLVNELFPFVRGSITFHIVEGKKRKYSTHGFSYLFYFSIDG
jgi:hypothetical protein